MIKGAAGIRHRQEAGRRTPSYHRNAQAQVQVEAVLVGGNVTGFSMLLTDLAASRQLELALFMDAKLDVAKMPA